MRESILALLFATLTMPLFAQGPPPATRRVVRPLPSNTQAGNAESAVKQAMEQLASMRKGFEKDIDVLTRLRAADEALTEPSQPNNAIQKALDEVRTAKNLGPDFTVNQGIIKIERELEQARLSPSMTDFGRMRGMLRSEAIGPATRVVARNGARLQEETLSWIRVQEMIVGHIRMLSEVSADSLRAAMQ